MKRDQEKSPAGYLQAGCNSMAFGDSQQEAAFMASWEVFSRQNVLLTSGIVACWTVIVLLNVHMRCHWSHTFCAASEVLMACNFIVHLIVQYKSRRSGALTDERNKAYMLVLNLIVAIVFVILQKDFEAVALATPAGVYAIYGWATTFTQVCAASSSYHCRISDASLSLICST
jgi:hypothetical protein